MFSESNVCPGTRVGPASSGCTAAGHAVRVTTGRASPGELVSLLEVSVG